MKRNTQKTKLIDQLPDTLLLKQIDWNLSFQQQIVFVYTFHYILQVWRKIVQQMRRP